MGVSGCHVPTSIFPRTQLRMGSSSTNTGHTLYRRPSYAALPFFVDSSSLSRSPAVRRLRVPSCLVFEQKKKPKSANRPEPALAAPWCGSAAASSPAREADGAETEPFPPLHGETQPAWPRSRDRGTGDAEGEVPAEPNWKRQEEINTRRRGGRRGSRGHAPSPRRRGRSGR